MTDEEKAILQAVGDDAVSLINEAIARYEQGKPGVVTYLYLARGRLKDNGFTTKKSKHE